MTPDQFFDELDKIFGCDDGYVNHLQRIKELKAEKDGWKAARDDDIREAVGEASDVLAQKFYDHYGGQGTDTLYFARQTGPSLSNMVDFVLKENKELKEQDNFERGYDAGREEYQVDQEFLDEKDKEIEKLKEENKELKEQVEENTTYAVLPEEGKFLDQLKELQEKYDHLRSVHSKVVQDLNARTEKVIEMTLQQQ